MYYKINTLIKKIIRGAQPDLQINITFGQKKVPQSDRPSDRYIKLQ